MRHILVVLCLALGLAACADGPGASPLGPGPLPLGCQLIPRAQAPLRTLHNLMFATVSLNGQPATMVVDTGAEVTTLTPAIAAHLGLPAVSENGAPKMLHGIAGDVVSRRLRLATLELGGRPMRRDLVVEVGTLPAFPGVVPPVAGLLGADVLAGYEMELDLPDRRLALYSALGCNGYTPWPGSVAVPMVHARPGFVLIDAQVNGRRVRALVDSGARTTLLHHATALALGMTEASLAADHTVNGVGIGTGRVVLRQHRVDAFGVPGDLVRGATIDIGTLDVPGVDMLLGADFLGERRVWISYATGRLFLRR